MAGSPDFVRPKPHPGRETDDGWEAFGDDHCDWFVVDA
jgi:hypothetical protein